jgi:hypothetical protein
MINANSANNPVPAANDLSDYSQPFAPQATSAEFDITSLRIPSNFGATLGVKKILNLVPVGKPTPTQFFRSHTNDAMQFNAMLLAPKGSQENYLVTHQVAGHIPELVKSVTLMLVIDRQNNLRLVPVPLPGPEGQRNPWHQTLLDAITLSKTNWLRINANLGNGGYDVFQAQVELPDPEWPDHTIDEIIKVAFRGRIINDLAHPVVQGLLGRV